MRAEGKGALAEQCSTRASEHPRLCDKKALQHVSMVGDADSLIPCNEKIRQLCHAVTPGLYLKHQLRCWIKRRKC